MRKAFGGGSKGKGGSGKKGGGSESGGSEKTLREIEEEFENRGFVDDNASTSGGGGGGSTTGTGSAAGGGGGRGSLEGDGKKEAPWKTVAGSAGNKRSI